MRYKNALIYLEKKWPRSAAWVEQTIGPRDGNYPQVNSDLAVSASGDHLFLVQSGLLIWIASGRPLNQPQNNWRGASLLEIQKMFLGMENEALKAYLASNEEIYEPIVQAPSVPPRVPVATGSPTQSRPNPPGGGVPTGFPMPPTLLRPSPPHVPPTTGLPPPPPPLTLPSLGAIGASLQPPLPQSRALPPAPVSTGLPMQAAQIPVAVSPPVRPRRASRGPQVVTPAEMMKWIEAMQDLKTIFICDIPTGTRGVYLTERSTGALADNAKVNIAKISNPDGWLNLGRSVLTNRMGKCWSCAAAVIHKIVTDSRFNSVRVESIGAKDYDHHFVVINRDPGTDVKNISTWNDGAILIDAWQANLNNWVDVSPGQAKETKLCYAKGDDFPYKSEIKFFCAFEVHDRPQHRVTAKEVGIFVSQQAQTIRASWERLKTCYQNHFLKGQKNPSCPVSGFCDKRQV